MDYARAVLPFFGLMEGMQPRAQAPGADKTASTKLELAQNAHDFSPKK